MCGLNFNKGQTWLIFAYENNGSYSSYLCTRSKEVNPNSSFNLQEGRKIIGYSIGGFNFELLEGVMVEKWELFKNGLLGRFTNYLTDGFLDSTW